MECSPNVTLRLGVQPSEPSPDSSSEVDENITDIIQRHLQPLTHYGQPTHVVMYDSPDDNDEMYDPDFTGMITTSPSIQKQFNKDKKPIELKPLTHGVKRMAINESQKIPTPHQESEAAIEYSENSSDDDDDSFGTSNFVLEAAIHAKCRFSG